MAAATSAKTAAAPAAAAKKHGSRKSPSARCRLASGFDRLVSIMKCPHCLTGIHKNFAMFGSVDFPPMRTESGNHWPARGVRALSQLCPECQQIIVRADILAAGNLKQSFVVFPKATARPIPAEVTEPYRTDFDEATTVLADSAKASAALSRRCLQLLLRDCAKVKPADLSKEIDEILARGTLPSYLAEAIDAIRNIGNFAAHPLKSTNTGEIIEVEPGEADWLLDVLEGMFDFYFVQPAILKKKRDDLNAKLADAKKPPMK